MSETTATPEALGAQPPAPVRQLKGNLGVPSIVFMVVAAAAPLGVIGGRVMALASRRHSSYRR